ncbi:MAG: hypothetical protein AB7F78_09360 [Hyphomicrobiaceae bacterium]
MRHALGWVAGVLALLTASPAAVWPARAEPPPLAAPSLPVPSLPATDTSSPPEPGTLAAEIAREPGCPERSNGCEICVGVPGAGGRLLTCSSPGIACQPGAWTCSRPADPLPGPSTDRP